MNMQGWMSQDGLEEGWRDEYVGLDELGWIRGGMDEYVGLNELGWIRGELNG